MEVEIEVEAESEAEPKVSLVMEEEAEVWVRERIGDVLARALCACMPALLRH